MVYGIPDFLVKDFGIHDLWHGLKLMASRIPEIAALSHTLNSTPQTLNPKPLAAAYTLFRTDRQPFVTFIAREDPQDSSKSRTPSFLLWV